jgi:hypothetical protein
MGILSGKTPPDNQGSPYSESSVSKDIDRSVPNSLVVDNTVYPNRNAMLYRLTRMHLPPPEKGKESNVNLGKEIIRRAAKAWLLYVVNVP